MDKAIKLQVLYFSLSVKELFISLKYAKLILATEANSSSSGREAIGADQNMSAFNSYRCLSLFTSMLLFVEITFPRIQHITDINLFSVKW